MTTVTSDSIGQGIIYGGIHRLWNICHKNKTYAVLCSFGGGKLSDFSLLKAVGG